MLDENSTTEELAVAIARVEQDLSNVTEITNVVSLKQEHDRLQHAFTLASFRERHPEALPPQSS